MSAAVCLSRACGPRTRRPKPEEALFRSLMCPKRQEKAAARCVGTSREASPIEGVSCASDARETSEPHVFLRRGDVGVAQGGGAEKDASGGPQERPGSGLSKKAPARRAAPGVVSSEPLLREGEKGASRRCSRLRKASAADIGEVGAASAGTRAVPLPEATAAGRGVAGPSRAAPECAPEGEFFALRDSVARAAAGAGSRARDDGAPYDPRAKRRRAREEEAGQRRVRLRSSWPSTPRR